MVNRSTGGVAMPKPPWWLRRGVALAVALFALAVVLAIWNLAASDIARGRVGSQARFVLALERLLGAARDMETGSRGYVLVGSGEYLDPYNAALTSLGAAEDEVSTAWRALGEESAGMRPLFDTLAQKRRYVVQLVETRERQGFEAAQALVGSGQGKRTMDAFRRSVAELQGWADKRRLGIERAERRRSLLLTVGSGATSLAACLLLGLVAWRRRKIAQETSAELAGLGDRFRTLADNIPQLAWMAAGDGRIFWYNQRWYDYTGTSPAEMANDGWRKVHHPDHVQSAAAKFYSSVTAGQDWQDTFPLRGRDGAYRWFLSRAHPIRGSDGQVQRWFGTNTDVTEQREQEQELAAAKDAAEEANQAKSQFIANMSHELRTPLSAVIGYSEMLQEEVEDLGERHLLADLGKIKSNAQHLLSLINDVLDISKIEANKVEIFAETFDVAEMVRDVAATVGSLVEKKGNTLAVELAVELGSMHSDVVKIRQVLLNLLSNSAKFTENGEIHLGARREPGPDGIDRIVLEVRDTGVGMTEEQVAKLFQRFTQADSSTTRRFGGTGLGLAITRAFMDMLGGEVSVQSRTGEGSTFTLTIPATLPAAKVAEADGVEDAAASQDDTVLVIDDDEATRDLLTRFLIREGFTVRTAPDGKAGLAMAASLKPRVILLDVTMPRMDGWTVLRSLKDDPHLSAIPVVMCTIIDEQTLGFSLGASDYVLKPVNWERLKEVLARVQKDSAQGDVLLVDDDADTRARIGALLSRNGWTVSEAENGRAALDAVRQRAPSLVLLDLTMPEMDGFTFLREFRAAPEWAAVPVVVMTARDLSAGERAELKGGGAARVVEKGSLGMKDLVGQLRAIQPPRPAAGKTAERASGQAAPPLALTPTPAA